MQISPLIMHTSYHKADYELGVHTAKLKAFAVLKLSMLCCALLQRLPA